MKDAIKVLLVVLFLVTGYHQYLGRLADLSASSVSSAVAYLVLFGILSLSLLSSAFVPNGFLRWFLAVLFTVAAAFCDTYFRITNEFLTYNDFITQLESSSFLSEAVQQHWLSIVWAWGLALLLLIGIGLRPGTGRPSVVGVWPRLSLAGPMVAASPLVALLLLTVILFLRGGDGGRGLPPMFPPLAYLSLLAYEGVTDSIGPRETVQLPRKAGPVGYDIALIVDESVSGNYLDVNAADGVPTPFMRPPAGVSVYNYGYAAAIANCSVAVNLTLRFGGTREDYVRINARMPSIWQYAKVAGLQTVYIDAQRTDRQLINKMTAQEMQDVDQWIQFDGVTVRDRDMAAAARLAALFTDSIPQLIIVNKMGAHFPVHDKAPDAFVRYRPALARGDYEDIADTGLRFGFAGDAAGWALYRNSYRNTLLWTVGEFFTRLFAPGTLDHTVILYTSDHGQDLHERGNPGQSTHCGGSPVMEEGLVPLVVLQGAGLETLDWQAHLAQNRNRSSHYNIFPTLLQLMGYELDAITATYGNPLTVVTNDPFTFNSRFNARLGTQPRWEFIDLDQIVTPPVTDSSPVR